MGLAGIHQLFEEQVCRSPRNVAVVFEESSLSYDELNRRSNQLAHYLVEQGVGPDTLVGLCVERSLELVIGILAILKAGGAYVPLDPHYPKARLDFMLSDSAVKWILTTQAWIDDDVVPAALAIRLDDAGLFEDYPDSNLSQVHELMPSHLAYVIYTSGSTGQPKGVMVEHRNVQRLLTTTESLFRFSASDVWTLFHSYAFDFSVWEIWGALAYGGRLVVVPWWVSRSPEAFYNLLREESVTVLNQTPTAFMQLSDVDGSVQGDLSLRVVVFGGEALSLSKLQPWVERHGDNCPVLVNMYGITETTVHVTYRRLLEADVKGNGGSLIGRPLDDLAVYILDADRQLAPMEVHGEMYVGGAGVTRGYLHREALTLERFIADPFNESVEARLYKTGDLARWLPTGELEFVGRCDDQVKIRGFRIELGEIESVINRSPLLKDVVTILQHDAEKGDYIVAYLVVDKDTLQSLDRTDIEKDVRKLCSESLPEYMVPSAFGFLDVLPLTPNGKIDKKALPLLDPSSQQVEYVAPRNEIEARLCAIWQEVLKLERVSIHDKFFELGGHSLLAIRVVSLIRSTFNNEIEVRALFDNPTVASLAGELDKSQSGFMLPPIDAVDRNGDLPLSYAQQRLWFIDQYEGDGGQYNVPGRIQLSGSLNKPVLERAITTLLERHEILRTLIAVREGIGYQAIQGTFTLPLEERDLTGLSVEAQSAEVSRILAADGRRPFDLTAELPIRFTLLQLSADRQVILFNMHHIVTDGWSLATMQTELNRLYDAFCAGHDNPLPPLKLQYADYAVWQRNWLKGAYLETELGYWRQQLANIPVVHSLPLDKARPSHQTFEGDVHAQLFDRALSDRIYAFCQSHDVTLYMFLQSAFAVLLARYSGETDIVMGLPVAGRIHKDLEPMLGFFINNLVLRSRLDDNPRFADFLAAQRTHILDAHAHQTIQFEMLVDELQPARALNHSPLFQIMFVLQNNEQGELGGAGLELVGYLGKGDKAAQVAGLKYDLEWHVVENDAGLDISWVYNRALFEHRSIERMSASFAVLVEGILANANQPVQLLPVLSATDRRQLLVDWNATQIAYPTEICIHQLFEEQVRRTPQRAAVVFEGAKLSYDELNRRGNRLAHYLVEQGVKPDTLVGLCIDRSLEMMIGILGILKAGAAYLPFDPNYPAERLRFVLEDTGVKFVVSRRTVADNLPFLLEYDKERLALLLLDDPAQLATLAAYDDGNRDPSMLGLTSSHLAYVIYTSGSTGKPKGVCTEHRNTVALLSWANRVFCDGQLQKVLASSSVCFDASVIELFAPLTSGGCAFIVKDILEVSRQLLQEVTLITTVPSAIETLLSADLITDSVKTINLGGEHLKQTLVDNLYKKGVQAVHDLYGPTEDTTYSIYCLRKMGGATTIGKPIDNTQTYVLNNALQPVPIGTAGELYIGGAGLARGYWNRPELTAEKFIRNPFSEEEGARLYRTGDLVRYQPDGNIKYIGRIDHQVKVRGFRIELGEIEHRLNTHPRVKESVVVVKDENARRQLIAYYVLDAKDSEPTFSDAKELKTYLLKTLPDYMSPDFFVEVDAIPLNANGKTDRKALMDRQIDLKKSKLVRTESEHRQESQRVEPAAPMHYAQPALEQDVLALWRDVLKVDDIDPTDGFFDVGGNSLLAMVLAHRIGQHFGVEFKVPLLFKHSSVQQISQYLGARSQQQTCSQQRIGAEQVEQAPSRVEATGKDVGKEAGGAADNSAQLQRPHPDYYQDSLAIIGISCDVPGATDHRKFWENIRAGTESTRFFSEQELRAANVSDALIHNPHYVPMQLTIEGKDYFDSDFFNIPPKNAAFMDPQFRLLLQHSWQAVEDAGYSPAEIPETGVFMAASNSYYQTLLRNSNEIDEADDYVAWMLAQGGSIPTTVSYELGFRGPSIFVHTNCSSSLVALSLAYKSLQQNEAKFALVGAAAVLSNERIGYVYRPGLNFSSDGHCKTFDASADGLTGGEGVAVLVVKRALDAIADGDHIYALIRGVAVNNDGSDKAGYHAPSVAGQVDVIEKVLQATGINPDTIGYVEAHGTGTKIGDPIEVAALTEAYQRYVERKQYCAIGSVKPNIGHLDTAAGLAGCIKVALSLQHGVIPPSINYRTPNPDIDFENSPFYVPQTAREWPIKPYPRRAGLSSFGMGGTNTHAILEAYPAPRAKDATASPVRGQQYLIPLSAKNKERLFAAAENLLEFLQEAPIDALDIGELSHTLQVGREEMDSRLIFVSRDLQSFIGQLRDFVSGKSSANECFQGGVRKGEGQSDGLEDDDSEVLIKSWIAKGKYTSLARFWAQGGRVEWSSLYGDSRPRRISLPTYPFAKRRYSIETANSRVEKVLSGVGQLHPLVHRNTSTSFDTQFTSTFTGAEFFLKDHQIQRTKVLPGVGHLEMASVAIRQAYGLPLQPGSRSTNDDVVIELRDVVWLQPATLTGDSLSLHISVTPTSEAEAEFDIYSIDANGEEVLYSQGCGRLLTNAQPAAIDLARLQSICTRQPLSRDEFYAAFAALDTQYGPSHRNIEALYTSVNDSRRPQVLATLKMPSTPGEFGLHPGLLDSALQASIGMFCAGSPVPSTLSLPLSLPFALSSITIYHGLPQQAYSWVRFSEGSQAGDSVQKFDVSVCDENGVVCAALTGFSSRVLRSDELKTKPAVFTGLWRPQWQPVPLVNLSTPIADHRVLLVGAFTKNEHEALQAALPGTINCQRLDVATGSLSTRYTQTAEKLFTNIQQLLSGRPRESVLVQVIVHSTDRCFAGLSGLLKTASQENPKLFTQCIELADDTDASTLSEIIRDNARDVASQELRYRNGAREVKILQELQAVSVDPETDTPWKDKGVYLITGGLGGLGLIFAHDIAAKVRNATVILAGRSALVERKQAQIEELIAKGLTVEYRALDVANWESVQGLFAHIRNTYGKLTGILHSAGVIHDNFIWKKTTDELQQVFAPKVVGLTNLDEASQDIPLEQFICFSSIASALGNAGQTDYAAANGFMDAYAEYRNQLVARGKRHGKTLSINWPGWVDGGMQMQVDVAVHTQKRLQGFSSLSNEQGLRAFAQSLHSGCDQVVVLCGDLNRLRTLLTASPATPSSRPSVVDVDTGALLSKVQQMLKQQVSAQLKIRVEELDLDTELYEHGFDSISLTELGNQLNERFRLNLMPTIFFEYPTLGDFAGYLVKEHGVLLSQALNLHSSSHTTPVAMSSSVTPIVGSRATRRRRGLRPNLISLPSQVEDDARSEAIAIIGMSGCFPQAPDIDAFWDNLQAGKDCITEIPANRWDYREYFDAQRGKAGKTYSKWGGFIDGVDEFDALFFNISPKEARFTDPQERLFVQCVYRTLEDAGYTREDLKKYCARGLDGNVGVFVGVMYQEYQLYGAQAQASGQPYALSGSPSSIANRVSYFCNFHGPSMAVDTMCSSSLTAIHLACQSIKHGGCEVAIAGGVNVSVHPNKYLLLAQGQFASSTGRCQSFGQGGDGYVPGEGVGAVLLKPLSKAMADRDHIYGVIKGTSINHGGKANGYTVPNPRAHAQVIASALEDAKIDPRTISYIEAHGTGTSLGDPIEIAGLTQAYSQYTQDREYCAIGSAKSNIGHLESAAGIAGLTKVLLQMKHRKLVPSLHAQVSNPHIDFTQTPFKVQQHLSDWMRPVATIDGREMECPRIAGISSFGAGGSNAHVIVEEYRELRADESASSTFTGAHPALIVLSAKTEEQLGEQANQLLRHVQSHACTDIDLGDIAYTLQLGREAMEYRLALTATSIEELEQKLSRYAEGQTEVGSMEGCYEGETRKSKEILATLNADVDFSETVDKWIRQGKYSHLLELWVKGLTLDWRNLYREGSAYRIAQPKRISLPTYPFAKERYWIEPINTPVGEPLNSVGRLHPLIHRNTSTSFDTQFTSTFTGEEFFLKDHQVQHIKVLPGVGHLEMASVAIRQAYGLPLMPDKRSANDDVVIELKDVVWLRPVTLTDDSLSLHISVTTTSETEAEFDIYSVDANDEEVLYSQGHGRLLDNTQPAAIDLVHLRAICTRELLSREQIYAGFANCGTQYGPAHQGIDALYTSVDSRRPQVLATLHMPTTLGEFGLHPGLLDSALQASIGLSFAGRRDPSALNLPLSLPFALSSITIYHGLPQQAYVWVRFNEGSHPGDAVQKLDISVCDEQGVVCAELKGFSSRKLEGSLASPKLSANQPLLQSLLPCWDVVAGTVLRQSKGALPNPATTWLLGATHLPNAELWQAVLPGASEHSGLAALSQGELNTLFSSAAPVDHLVWILPQSTCDQVDDDALITEQASGVLFGLRLMKTLLSSVHANRDLRLSVITWQTQAIGADVHYPAHASVHGLIGSLAKEIPHWSIRLLDMPLAAGADIIDTGLSLAYDDKGDAWAHRQGQWYRQHLVPVDLPAVNAATSQYRQQGVYVVIGGAGGIGEVWSEHLIREYQAQIIWLGRRAVDDKIEGKLDRLSALGPRPLYLQADATDRKALTQAHQQILSRYGVIHGVVHSAIVLNDKSIAMMDEARFSSSLRAKVDTSVRLAQVFKEDDLDFVLFFSSLQSFVKAPGQSNYSAGCTFKDAFAQRLAQTLSCPVKIMNWGYWGSVGVVTDQSYRDRTAAKGIGSLEPAEGLPVLQQLLAVPLTQLGVMKVTTQAALESLTGSNAQKGNVLAATTARWDTLFASLNSPLATRLEDLDPPRYSKTELADQEAFNQLQQQLLWQQLQCLGFSCGETGWATTRTILPMYTAWFDEAARLMRAAGYPAAASGKTTDDLWSEWKEVTAGFTTAGMSVRVELVAATLSVLPDILTGVTPVTDILFPNASMEKVEGIYKHNPQADYFNAALAEAVVTRVAANPSQPNQRKLRLLEIGAGTGGTSVTVFKALEPYRDRIEVYTYTDLSRAFLMHAERSYREIAPYLDGRIFNVEQGPQEQGIDLGSYDIVIAANVLHATRNIHITLRNAKAAMKANGVLLISEITASDLFAHLTFGLTEGWWLAEDAECRMTGSPALSMASWSRVLRDEGFDCVRWPVASENDLGHQVIIAHSDGVIKQAVRSTVSGQAIP